jgi:hypothetical protein
MQRGVAWRGVGSAHPPTAALSAGPPAPRDGAAGTRGSDVPWNAGNRMRLARCNVSSYGGSHQQAAPAPVMDRSLKPRRLTAWDASQRLAAG